MTPFLRDHEKPQSLSAPRTHLKNPAEQAYGQGLHCAGSKVSVRERGFGFLAACGVLIALGLAGCAGGGGGSGSSIVSTSSESSATLFGYSGSYNETTATNFASNTGFVGFQEFQNVSQYASGGGATSSTVHPYVLTNVHKAYGYGLSGSGKTIAVLDTGFNSAAQFASGSAFAEMQSKYNAGQITLNGQTGSQSTNHGTIVSSIAAARFDGQGSSYFQTVSGAPYPAFLQNAFPLLNHGMMGVAYNARLHLSDLDVYTGMSGLTQATQAAANVGAVVQNNSWGLPNTPGDLMSGTMALPTSIPSDISGYASAQVSQYLATATNYSESEWNNYYTALKNFSSRGVVVFALQNTSSASQPSLMAALPQLYADLKPSWIAVGNVDTSGTGPTVSRQSAACNAAASYCLVVDGTQVTGAGLQNSQGYSIGQTGTSFAAPQVSGMVALMAEAFPTLRPDQLATRLFATANNRFFRATATRDFGSGVTHGYNNEFGHGIPDMYAALQPIGGASVVLNGSPDTGSRVPVAGSSLLASPAFGPAVQKALDGVTSQAYDLLGAPFEINLGGLTRSQTRPGYLSLSNASLTPQAFNALGLGNSQSSHASPPVASLAGGVVRLSANQSLLGLSQGSGWGASAHAANTKASLTSFHQSLWASHRVGDGFMQSPMQFAAQFSANPGQSLLGYSGYSNPRFALNGENPNVVGLALTQKFSPEAKASNIDTTTAALEAGVTLGFQVENDAVRGARSTGALAFGSRSHSFYLAPQVNWKKGGWSFMVGGSVGITQASSEANASMVVSAGPMVSSEMYASAARMLSPHSTLFIKAWQPETIEHAQLSLSLPGLAATDQAVPLSQKSVSLAADQRPFLLSVGLHQQLSKTTSLTHEVFASQGLGQNTDGLNTTDTGLQVRWDRRF